MHALRNATTTSRAEQPTLEACVAAAAISLSLVMAGSGNLDCLRLLRVLRRRVDADVTYGYHLAIGMAIGFLFLGGGRLTLGTSNSSIAALLAAIFPCFPMSQSDNRYHLQVPAPNRASGTPHALAPLRHTPPPRTRQHQP